VLFSVEDLIWALRSICFQFSGPIDLVGLIDAMAGVCGVGVILFAALSRFCPISAMASWGVGFGPPLIARAVQAEEPFHPARAVLTGNPPIFRGAFQ